MRSSFIILLFLLFIPNINAQKRLSLECEEAPVFCNFEELDGFKARNPDLDNPTGPNPLCFGTGVPHNTNWWAFVGNGKFLNLVFEIDPSDCTGRGTGCSGIQVGIIDDCGGNPLDCNANCNVSTLILSGQTINCHTYYVWVDGCCGDVCEYTIRVTDGETGSLPDTITQPYLSSKSCACGTVKVCVDELKNNCESSKTWMVDGVVQAQGINQKCIDFQVPNVLSPIEVCVTHIIGNPREPNAICDQATSCFTFLPDTTIQDVNEGELFVCWEDHKDTGYNWNDTIIYNNCINPPCRKRQKRNGEDCCANYTAQITLLPKPVTSKIYKFICNKNELPFITKDGRKWNTELCDELITWQGSNQNQCDTGYNLYLSIFDPKINLTRSCGSCKDEVTINSNMQYDFDCSFGELTIQRIWINSSQDTVGDDDILITKEEGVFTFSLKVLFKDTLTNMNYSCNLSHNSWKIEIKHSALEVLGETEICAPDTATYTLPNSYKNNCGKVNWFIKNGNGIIMPIDSISHKEIQVVWSESKNSTGTICMEILNACRELEEKCLTVKLSTPTELNYKFEPHYCGLTAKINKGTSGQNEDWISQNGAGRKADINQFLDYTEIKVDKYGKYFFKLSVTNGSCETIDTTIELLFVPIPFWIDPTFVCSKDKLQYRILFDAVGFPPSLTAQDSSGWFATMIGNNQFITPWINNRQRIYITLVDEFECQTIPLDTVFDCMDVAVQNIPSFGVRISPNPVYDFIHITTDKIEINLHEMNVRIIDIGGTSIIDLPKTYIGGGVLLDVRKLSAGMYFIQLINGDEMEVVKFVKVGR